MPKASVQPQKRAPSSRAPRGLLDRYTADQLPYLSEQHVTRLRKLCGERWLDLLLHLPRDIVDRRLVSTIAERPEEPATFELKIIEHGRTPPRRKGRRIPYKIVAEDKTGSVELIFFNFAPWLPKALPVGETVIVHGQLKVSPHPQLIHPQLFGITKSLTDVATVVPSYSLTQGLTQFHIRTAVTQALKLLADRPPPEWLPDTILQKYKLPSFADALRSVHNPQRAQDLDPLSKPRMRLGLDELFANNIALAKARQDAKWQPGYPHPQSTEIRSKFLAQLPFALTSDQRTVLAEIDADMAAASPMRRLVQGDVGSGKTVVALTAMVRALAAGKQTALLAPTGILAEQHFAQAEKYLKPLGYSVALLTGKLTASQKAKVKEALKAGFIQAVVGTHALLEDSVKIPDLSLVVIDEQHRFGVQQRLKLNQHGQLPDLLSMTATPIPRTLALTLYGDLDVSQIREKPPGRQPIETVALSLNKLPAITESLQRVLDKNEQVYWVCPLVEENEESDLTSATERFEYIHKSYGDIVGLLHGKMKDAEKEKILTKFRDGELKILVSTTVIEVGVDVPKATTMVIEHAERFGLSQLHQLRGRVGRGSAQSHCMLLYASPLTEYAEKRINALRQSDDGFWLAEEDLTLRGPGEMLGTAQAGAWRTRLADLVKHADLMPIARDLADETLADVKNLNKQKLTVLRGLLKLFHKEHGAELLGAG